MYSAKLEASFSWPHPSCQMLTEERREATIEKMLQTDYLLYDDRPRDLPCVARVDLFGHRTVYVFSNLELRAGVFRKTINEKISTFDILGVRSNRTIKKLAPVIGQIILCIVASRRSSVSIW